VLTGEAFPVEKSPVTSSPEASLAERTGALFKGTSIRSGTCRMLVVADGRGNGFRLIERDLEQAEETTEFARGLAGFGAMLMRVMLIVVAMVLIAAMLQGRDLMSSLLFAMALAVAISPELLPAIVSVTLAAGARGMTRHGVLVRRLQAIENLGGMDILCTDKTGYAHRRRHRAERRRRAGGGHFLGGAAARRDQFPIADQHAERIGRGNPDRRLGCRYCHAGRGKAARGSL